MESGEKFLIVGGVGLIVGVDWDTIIENSFSENSKIQPLSISWSINIPSPKYSKHFNNYYIHHTLLIVHSLKVLMLNVYFLETQC